MRRLRPRPQLPSLSAPISPASEMPGERELALEHELAAVQARLERFVYSNAEYEAINEELQSANEALLVSREELQAVNLELQAINGELADRLTELARVHGETANLLASTRIATLFLDVTRRIRSFTPRAAELFALADTDLEQPATLLGARLPYLELEHDVDMVLENLTRAKREIRTHGGRRCTARVLPHYDLDGFLAGAVVIFHELA